MEDYQNHVYFFSLEEFNVEKDPESLVRQYNDNSLKARMEIALEDKRLSRFGIYLLQLRCTFVAPTEEAANERCKTVKAQ